MDARIKQRKSKKMERAARSRSGTDPAADIRVNECEVRAVLSLAMASWASSDADSVQ
jgi:hypothetical protein